MLLVLKHQLVYGMNQAVFCLLIATFEIANKKATKAQYTSDLATTDAPTDAMSDVELDPEKRRSKRRVIYSPDSSPRKCAKRPESTEYDTTRPVLSSLENLPAVPAALLDMNTETQCPASAETSGSLAAMQDHQVLPPSGADNSQIATQTLTTAVSATLEEDRHPSSAASGSRTPMQKQQNSTTHMQNAKAARPYGHLVSVGDQRSCDRGCSVSSVMTVSPMVEDGHEPSSASNNKTPIRARSADCKFTLPSHPLTGLNYFGFNILSAIESGRRLCDASVCVRCVCVSKHSVTLIFQ